ncbi:hypothetical protein LTR33_012284 [Friedmanniomyces endolithicus]|nr:hypothetical protein LTR33_012284 [Friedmanniomyces endolithicus]
MSAAPNARDEQPEDGSNVDRLYCAKLQQISTAFIEKDMEFVKDAGEEILMDPYLPRLHRAAVTVFDYMDRSAAPADDEARIGIAGLHATVDECLADLRDTDVEVTHSEGEDQGEETVSPAHNSSDGRVVSESDPRTAIAGEEAAGVGIWVAAQRAAGPRSLRLCSGPGAHDSGPSDLTASLSPPLTVEDEYLAEDEGRARSPTRRSPAKEGGRGGRARVGRGGQGSVGVEGETSILPSAEQDGSY